jgi:DnaJ family protein C protein 11
LGREQREGIREGNKRSGVRGEIEIGASRDRDLFVAVRALRRVGRFSRVGVEVGVSRANVHLSVYWSRLGRRVTVPVLLGRGGEVVFWGVVLPFLGMGMLEMWDRRRGNKKKDRAGSMSKEEMQGYITRRRAEADELTVVMASGVEPRQRIERQAGGLVIVSAKYSVKGAPSDEVADVTVAVAALVNGGELLIPKGLRKSRLLGFWDPAPRQTKVLTVRYLYQGKEGFVEVVGREELRLPRAVEKTG